jgi:hypothetical protein
LQASLYGLLVSGSSVLQAKRHGNIAVGSIWGDEGGLDLIRLRKLQKPTRFEVRASKNHQI